MAGGEGAMVATAGLIERRYGGPAWRSTPLETDADEAAGLGTAGAAGLAE
ncbi:hypothetical protein ACH4VX_30850 [Streptomyces sp. NPDC020731]